MRRKAGRALVAAFLAVAVLEAGSCLALGVANRFLDEPIRTTRDIFREQTALAQRLVALSSSGHLAIDTLLGWRYRPGYVDANNRINSQGLRSIREYSVRPSADVLRVAVFGNSFVYCNEVADAHAWPAVLEQLYPHIEVLNYGVGGYGVDQAYLRFQAEGMALSPRVVLIGFAPTDFGRVVNVYRRFLSNRELPLAKPRFIVDSDGELRLLPTPLPPTSDYARYLSNPRAVLALGRFDDWYAREVYENPLYDVSATVRLLSGLSVKVRRRSLDHDRLFRGRVLNPSSTAFALHVELFDRFAAEARAGGALPVVVFFPDRAPLIRVRKGEPSVYNPLLHDLTARGIPVLDASDAVRVGESDSRLEAWFMEGGHYSPAGNRLVAAWLGAQIGSLTGRSSPPSAVPMTSRAALR